LVWNLLREQIVPSTGATQGDFGVDFGFAATAPGAGRLVLNLSWNLWRDRWRINETAAP
jgi:hypothetical protein